MAMIIDFHPPQKSAPSLSAGEMLPACEIVIFPGVRIERTEKPHDDTGLEPDGGSDNRTSRPRKSS